MAERLSAQPNPAGKPDQAASDAPDPLDPWDEEVMGGSPLEYLMRAMSCECSDGCANCAPHVYGQPKDQGPAQPKQTAERPGDGLIASEERP